MKLELYKKDFCPYCQKVMRFIKKNELNDLIEYKDITKNLENKEYLIEHGGENMVPCLFIDDKQIGRASCRERV